MLTWKIETCQDCEVELKVEEDKGVLVLLPEGEMVTGEADQQLRATLEQLCEQGDTRVVVNFSQVPYIDSSVLGQLVYGYSLLRENGGDLKILTPSPRIRDLLEVTRLVSVFEIFEDQEEAVSSWA
jgi:anti-sigma B factor antagonist